MQLRTGRHTKASDIPGVRRNLRFDQDDIKHSQAGMALRAVRRKNRTPGGGALPSYLPSLLATNFSSLTMSAANLRMPSAVFSVAIAFSFKSHRNFFSSNSSR